MERTMNLDKFELKECVSDAVDAGDIEIQECLYLVKAKRGETIDGEYGGWASLPAEIDYPRFDGAPLPFLCWLDLDKVSALFSKVQGQGRLLIFQHSESLEQGVIHLSNEQVDSASVNKLELDDLYFREDGFSDLQDGKPYRKEGFKLVKGLSVKYIKDVSRGVERALDKIQPARTIGQISGFLGVEHDSIIERVTFIENDAEILLSNRKYWNTPLEKLPDGEDSPEMWSLGNLMKLDYSGITNRLIDTRAFLEEYQETLKKEVKEKGFKWTAKFTNTIKKFKSLEVKYSEEAVTDAGICNHWINDFSEAQSWFFDNDQLVITILSKLGYKGERFITKEEQDEIDEFSLEKHEEEMAIAVEALSEEVKELCKLAEKGDMDALKKLGEINLQEEKKETDRILSDPKASLYEKSLAQLKRIEKEEDDSVVISAMHVIQAELMKGASDMDLFDLQYLTRELWRVPHNISCARNRDKRDTLSKSDAKKLKKAVKWKSQYAEEELEQLYSQWMPWLSIFEASGWYWGDCGQRVYLSNAADLQKGDFSNYHKVLDFS